MVFPVARLWFWWMVDDNGGWPRWMVGDGLVDGGYWILDGGWWMMAWWILDFG